VNEPKQPISRVVYVLGAVHFLLHVLGQGDYELFRDELYYLACAKRLALGYVDHPPLSIFALRLNVAVLGDSQIALRIVPALLGGLTVVVAGLMARQFGGGRLAQGLASLSVILAPIYLISFGFFSMNAIELLLWSLGSYTLTLLVGRGEPRLWLVFGVIAGLGLLTKHTFVLLGAAVVVGLLLTGERRQLLSRWIWLGGAVALLLVLPNLLWQHWNDWPSLEFYRSATLNKNVDTPPLMAVFLQILVTNPGNLPLGLAGLYFFFREPAGRRYRFLGWAFAFLLVLIVFSGVSRPDRIAGIYPMLFAGGAVVLERLTRTRRWIGGGAAVLSVSAGLLQLPVSAPLLPARFAESTMSRMGSLLQSEQGKSPPLPQWLSDRRGWHDMAGAVTAAYETLTPEEQEEVFFYGSNYGRAGAIEHLGRGLPDRVLCGHNNYYHWSEDKLADTPAPSVLISVGLRREHLDALFASVEQVGETRCDRCMNYENGVPIFVARRPLKPLADVWAEFKHYE
jgi:hypothetical protein